MENKAYQDLMLKLEQIHEFFQSFSQKKEVVEAKENKGNKEVMDVWLDSNTVCERLNISTRTLYRLRKERLITYSVVRGQFRFKESDVAQIMNESIVVANPETFEELRQGYRSICKR
jgi:excisionase family DNA binding protein